ncbi:MCE family protein [Planomonospora venezuelensis]|uniref:Phospholipid/cholesterol/gamma-HCH transport system substrate-binding protein n=1 Tax=Planomonospora venezuelensis TaxID=1999 RepID=A0A841D879_PLAVE|nr:MlaD family protein [Planomonospora venezuelensis]MBB5964694.1 phospholipid/cholesterol/gamma-HCH transport system substrate-binding protein [Planomonospora venezuelensis]GIN03101.1 ABC transporter substrate-binding protein [Planomonospora venezuelensis]
MAPATRGETPLPVRLAISVVVIVAVVATLVVVVQSTANRSGMRLTAAFTRAGQGLDPNSPVKIRGITIGGVSAVTLDGGGRAVVTMHVDPGVRVPETVTAAIEPTSVFGPKFVNLILGAGETGGPYLGDGAVITRTQAPVDLSDSLADAYEGLGAVDPKDITAIVHTLGRGLDGKGPQLREIVDGAGEVVGVAHRRRDEFRRFIGDAAALSGSLSDKGDEITGISADVNVLTPGLLERADKIRALLREFDELSSLTAYGLRKHRGDLKAAVNAGERAAALIYAQLGLAGDGVRGLNQVLVALNDLAAGQGPGGANQLKMAAFVATDVCELFVGACGSTNGR